jgi:hypothetical protein
MCSASQFPELENLIAFVDANSVLSSCCSSSSSASSTPEGVRLPGSALIDALRQGGVLFGGDGTLSDGDGSENSNSSSNGLGTVEGDQPTEEGAAPVP